MQCIHATKQKQYTFQNKLIKIIIKIISHTHILFVFFPDVDKQKLIVQLLLKPHTKVI